MYLGCHGCFRPFMPAWPNQRACSRACRQRAWLRRHFAPPRRAPESCLWCGEWLVDTEHPTRRYCDGRCRTAAYRARLALRRKLMTLTVSRVILPGIGAVCVECLSRGHVAALPLRPGEVYTFGVTEPCAEYSWDVDAARAMVVARPRAARRLGRAWLATWLVERSSFTPEHLDHIPSDKLAEPGIVIQVLAGPPRGQPEPFPILIDGTHRAARCLRDGQEFWAYLLTEKEQRSICIYRRGGYVIECPSFPGEGITDRDAGIFATVGVELGVA